MNKDKEIECPYCFKKSKIKELEFKCINKRCTKDSEKIFGIGKNNRYDDKLSEECPDCHTISHKVICPNCKNPLPESTLKGTGMQGKDMIISVIGARDTGKSNYIGVLIHEFMYRVVPALGGTFVPFGNSLNEYNKRFGESLYNANVKIRQTDSALNQNANPLPLIFKLNLPNRKFWRRNTIDSYTFVFYDTAGEDLNDFETASTVAQYICKSKGIIFLLDPLQNKNVVSLLDTDEVDNATTGDTTQNVRRATDIMNDTSTLIRNDRNIPDKDKIDIPVAVVFSKYDVIDSIIREDAAPTLKKCSPHCNRGYFSVTDGNKVNDEVKGLLNAWNDIELIANIDLNYNNYAFFCSSAFGLHNNAKKDGKINRPNPHRIEDAFLWILAEKGAIPKK